ncbi:MAG: DUF2064 domain-containing protein, partial [Mycobacteriales bacterium]
LAGVLESVPVGLHVVPQRGDGLGDRLAAAFVDADTGGGPVLLVGMDTPQVRVDLLSDAMALLADADAVLGPALDGGWWALGLRDVRHAQVLRDVPMSTRDTAGRTLAALHRRGLCVRRLPRLRDVDTISDATAVAAIAPATRFARTLAGVLVEAKEPA